MRDTSTDNIFVEIALEIGVEVADKLESGEVVEGSTAWRILDLVMSRGGIVVYEDEEVGDSVECYAVAVEINRRHVFYLLKTGERSVCWVTSNQRSEVLKNIGSMEKALARCIEE